MITINLKKKNILKKNCIIKIISGNKKGFIGIIKMLNFQKQLLGVCAIHSIKNLDSENNSKSKKIEKKELIEEKIYFDKFDTINFILNLKKKLDKLTKNSLDIKSFFIIKYSNVMLLDEKTDHQDKIKSNLIDGIKIKSFKKSGSIQKAFKNYFKT